jgi:hypothetical protein
LAKTENHNRLIPLNYFAFRLSGMKRWLTVGSQSREATRSPAGIRRRHQ